MHYALHWDGKHMRSLTQVEKYIEHVAVLLTGTDGQEVLVSISGIEGPSTADNEARKIIDVCKIKTFQFMCLINLIFKN